MTREEIDDARGESRWPPALTLLVAIVVPLLLPDRFSLTPKWIGPALLTALLVAHTIADPGRIDRQSRASRTIGIALMAVLVAGAATQAVVLIAELVGGNKALNSADALLSSGALVWLNTIIAFTFLYWEIDGGGPVVRAHRGAKYPHLAFVQHTNPDLAPHLSFLDMGGHGDATLRVAGDAIECEFVCIPRPLERSDSPDGGPLRYRVAHHVPMWRNGERPRLEQRVIEGDPGLAL